MAESHYPVFWHWVQLSDAISFNSLYHDYKAKFMLIADDCIYPLTRLQVSMPRESVPFGHAHASEQLLSSDPFAGPGGLNKVRALLFPDMLLVRWITAASRGSCPRVASCPRANGPTKGKHARAYNQQYVCR